MEARRPTLSRQHASRDHRYPASITTIWCLGLTLGLGSQCTGWTTTSAGVTSRAIVFGLLACAYLCLSFITAERTSALPFSGGVYGVGRCALGYYLGFLIGSAEALSFVCYASALTLTVGHLVCDLAPVR
ncbi:hypothetical protein SDRG_07123 [Saprolegnia diclina VS20]|uniref:Amino acid permease/ SLC12A domain-containing protein n=1 Tax=Saprolegnia diclina (strain VS20) TaxID=1156394 RepID=T0RS73_SAPDV|nr:hypothetical protein SDRG_07123 [Saprolegnia diclina VS20]EQC35413.1 hypothetical protein SDRG_07123 [Saprolegnia diclina VS20]|eukprot:XP_008611163.1 hypothetical protein SDRG_07123 [Saprolegnia diclina VS20]